MTLKRFLIPFAMLFLLASCQAELVPDTQADELPVTVSMSLTVAPMAAGTEEGLSTRAVNAPVNPADITIHNLCIMQYRGTTDDATLVGEPIYLSDDADPEDDEKYLDLNRIRMRGSAGDIHTLVLLANTGVKLPAVATLGEMKALYRTVTQPQEDRVNGLAVTSIDHGTVINAILRRSFARVRVEISNDGTDGLAIRSVVLRNISEKDFYLTDYRYIDSGDGMERYIDDRGINDAYNPLKPMRRDAEPEAWNGTADGTGSGTFTWCIPANMRGVDHSVSHPSLKGSSQLAAGATYLQINAVYGDAHDKPITYTFYLGEDLMSDFNLRPNGSYTYNFAFSGKGEPAFDKRIEDVSSIDFDLDANTYMLHPLADSPRSYSINVVHRPNIFWGERYGLKGSYPDNRIGVGDTWHVRLLWSTFEMTKEQADAFITHREGTGAGNYYSESQRVRIHLPAGQQEGVVRFSVYKDDPEYSLWSWTLWITAYDPDAIEGQKPISGVYLYNVPGGEVHRYVGGSWAAGGAYENGFAMDRDFGASDVLFHSQGQPGSGMQFQFGRKDPMPQNGVPLWSYNTDNTPSGGYSLPRSGTYGTIPEINTHPTWVYTMPYFINGDPLFNPFPFKKDNFWMDPYPSARTDHEEHGSNADKAIFDPCPAGWRIPDQYWVRGFSGDSQGASTASTYVNFQAGVETFNGHERGSGRTYYPKGFLAEKNNPDAQTIFFPYPVSGSAYYWSETPANYDMGRSYGRTPRISQGVCFQFSSSQVRYDWLANLYEHGKIRCVRK